MHNGITLHVTGDMQSIDLPSDSTFQKPASAPPMAARRSQQATNQPQTVMSSYIPPDTAPPPPPTLGYEGATYPSPVSSPDGMGMASIPTDDWQSMTTGSEWGSGGISSIGAFDNNMCFPDATSQFLFPPHVDEATLGPKRVVINPSVRERLVWAEHLASGLRIS
ncbi:hypothetical protein F4810DRAFT_715202 [Camillea tinctor]|nr:hypothetical protein F4810DRAFT_715202 [Camillea tinctor]